MSMSSQGISRAISAPVRGWNTRDDRNAMGDEYALDMENWFPDEQDVILRGGMEVFCSGLGGAAETLLEHVSVSGAKSFLAAAGGNIWDITTGTASSLASGLSSDRWQVVRMTDAGAGISVLVNGSDQPRKWDGTTLATTSFTGISDHTTLIQGTNYRGRIYFVAVGSGSLWYAGFGAIAGALTEFPVSTIFQKGGYPLFVTTWTRAGGDVLSEMLVVVSSEGEVLIYAGTSPDTDSFTLVGRRFLARPLGRRGFCKIGLDVEIETIEGIVSLSALTSDPRVSEPDLNISRNISSAWIAATRDYGALFGWEAIPDRRGKRILYNVPTSDGGAYQVVRNSITGAFCKFTGWAARAFGVFDDRLYFGAANGTVYRADSGTLDDGASIPTKLRWAYNYLGDRERLKKMALARPIITASNAVSFALGVDMDFEDGALSGTVVTEASENARWNVAAWGSARWRRAEVSSKNWYSISGLGRAAALKMNGQFRNTSMRLSAIHVIYTPGGML